MKRANTITGSAGKGSGAGEAPHRVMGFREWALVFSLSVIWGGSFFFTGVAVKEVTPFTIVLCRVGGAALILLAVVHLRGGRMPFSPKAWLAFFCMGALNNVIPFCLIVWGQTHIESSVASILNATTPIFSVLLAHFMTRGERITANRLAGVLCGWVGVAVLIGMKSILGGGMEVLGKVAVLGAALSYATAAIFGRRFRELDPIVVAAGMLCGSTVIIAPLALYFDRPWLLSPGLQTFGALLALAAVCTALAYIIYFKVLATAGPTNLMLVTFLIPPSAILLGVLVLGERLIWNVFAGMGLIFSGLAAIDGRLLKCLRQNISRIGSGD